MPSTVTGAGPCLSLVRDSSLERQACRNRLQQSPRLSLAGAGAAVGPAAEWGLRRGVCGGAGPASLQRAALGSAALAGGDSSCSRRRRRSRLQLSLAAAVVDKSTTGSLLPSTSASGRLVSGRFVVAGGLPFGRSGAVVAAPLLEEGVGICCASRRGSRNVPSRAVKAEAGGGVGMDSVLAAFRLQPATWQSSIIVTSTIFALGFPALAAGLTVPGIACAFMLGLLVWRAFGLAGFVTVCLYFLAGTAVTKVRMKEKEKEGIAEKRKGRRGPGSVIGSGTAGAVCALLSVLAEGKPELKAVAHLLQVGFVASFCTKLGDTTSSEIGKAFGQTTYLVTTLQRVPRGTEGAISAEGTAAGLAAAVLLAAAAVATGQVSLAEAFICVVASQIANLGESFVGATLQDKPGFEWMTNDVVNVFNITAGALLAMLAASVL